MTALSAREVAEAIGTDPKTLRMFLRSDASGFAKVGPGGRYAFTPADVPKLKPKFVTWQKGRTAKKAATKKSVPKAPVEKIESKA